MSSNLPINKWSGTGVEFPTPAQILAGACADMQQAGNNQFNLDHLVSSTLNTPQGQIASAEAQIKIAINADLAIIPAILDPNTCYGAYQDAMGRFFYDMQRLPALPTIVQIECTGLQGATIPVGAQVRDTAGQIYSCTQSGTIGVSGVITLPFSNIATGSIAATANTVNSIYNTNGATGWDSCNNPTDGIPGQTVETAQGFEARRKLLLGKNGHSQTSSLRAAAYSVNGVSHVYSWDNFTGAPITYLGVTVPAHSIYTAVVGGTDLSVATALLNKKGGGCNWYGNTTALVEDVDGYGAPYPTYSVSFERPASLPIYFTVTAVNSSGLPAGKDALVKAAVIAQFNGTNGAERETIASLIQAGKYYAPVQLAIPAIIINSITVDASAAPTGYSYQVAMNKYPTLSETNIVVTWV